jgi:hypothetical protein
MFESKNWEFQIDLEILNKNKNVYSTGTTNLYFIKERSEDLTPYMYGNGQRKELEGLNVRISENTKRALSDPDDPKSKN